MSTLKPVPFDTELEAGLAAFSEFLPPTLTPELIPKMRETPFNPPIEELLEGKNVTYTDHRVRGHDGTEIEVAVFTRTDHKPGGAAIYYVHGGGMVFGDRFTGAEALIDWVERYDLVAASVDYRLAPEYPDPVPVEDSYAGLEWFAGQGEQFGFDTSRLLIAGTSAGGGLAAGVALLSRDRSGPSLQAQLLMFPMLDDRNETISSQQFVGIGIWDRASNHTGWDALLGERRGTEDVSIYAAPGRAQDLGGLPPAYIEVGSAEVFRDESVAYATRIWEAGGQAELHVWSGGFHTFDGAVPQAVLSLSAQRARQEWLARMIGA